MRIFVSTSFRVVLIALILLTGMALSKPGAEGKVPVTTSSDEAKKAFLQGRNLFDKLRVQESRQYFEKAVASDQNFALGYLFLANSQPSAKGFFEYLDKAVAASGNASEGEQLWIKGAQAGASGNPTKQGELYQKLCNMYPNDERALTLLGNYYFGLQYYDKANEQYEKAISINPEFSQPYNQLGYSQRFLENYDEAEKAFKKYVELIPDDPNPYDSYAELLLKVGRYEESIQKYQEALKIDPNFVASHIGIATNLNFMGKHDAARKQLQKLYDMARDDGERRAAYFAMAVSYADEGNLNQALEMIKKQYAIAEGINDAAAMGGDLNTMANILIQMGKYDDARTDYEKSNSVVQASDLSGAVKANNQRFVPYNAAYVALKKKDLATAKTNAEEYQKLADEAKNTFQIRLAHQMNGMIALKEKEYDKALEELQKANLQDPYNLYRMALAYEGKGDQKKATEMFTKVANHNTLNNMNYAFIRNKAKQALVTN